ncbi:MAG: HAD family hydrolase [Bacteroidales bacterium]|jgi:histidinol-phosphate phosphatase family protein|nr:HAD family hydrolase [Bacteroidales bacterium]
MTQIKQMTTDIFLKPTLFLDRDGIVNERIMDGYVTSPEELVIRKDFIAAMKKLVPLFELIVIVTNQQGIAKGLMSEEDLEVVHQEMLEKLRKEGIFIDKVYHCPHREGTECGCRKPSVGMAEKAMEDFPSIDFQQSVMIGDSLSDILFGNKMGMTTVLISDSIPRPEIGSPMMPDFYFTTIQKFADTIS